MVCIAEEAVDLSASYYEEDEFELGHVATRIADTLLDVAVSITPGIGWGRDVYEAVTGVDLLSREELDVFSRSMAILGAVTAGVGSKLGKGVKVLGKLAKGEKAAEAVSVSRKAIAEAEGVSRSIIASKSQLQKKFKHAEVFGITGNVNKKTLEQFSEALENHVKSSSTKIIEGTYHQTQKVIHYVDPSSGINVMKKYSGDFISTWKLNPEQLKNVLERGSL